MNDVRVGLLGAGRIAQTAHLPAISKAAGARLVGVFDPSDTLREALSTRFGVGHYNSAEALFADNEVEAVIIAVPDRFHYPLASAALAAGKHVLVEKPMAGNIEDAEALVGEVKEAGLVLQVGAMKRHDPGVRYAADAVRSQIGRVLSASVWYRVMSALRPPTEATHFPPMVIDEDVRAHESQFKADRASYLLTTHGAHVLDGMRYLLGDPVDISARVARNDPDYSWHGIADLSGGGLAQFEITANVHSEWAEGAEIYGEKGSVRLRTHFPFLLQASDVEVFDEQRGLIERPVFADSNAYKLQVEAFARAIRSGTSAEPNAEDGLAAVRLINAVSESAEHGGVRVSL